MGHRKGLTDTTVIFHVCVEKKEIVLLMPFLFNLVTTKNFLTFTYSSLEFTFKRQKMNPNVYHDFYEMVFLATMFF